MVMYNI